MGLGVWFREDIAHVLCGVGDGVESMVARQGLQDATEAAYVAGYRAALRAVATGLGLLACEIGPTGGLLMERARPARWEKPDLPVWHWSEEGES
ncbi:MAG: hypothetical protein KKA73_26700 [Chloroflexi bacterium]|nr:hypothetical protein [Chloroflexota bacterium]MBU1751291.1 hypothetical protein [Chloroflexota bacterium]